MNRFARYAVVYSAAYMCFKPGIVKAHALKEQLMQKNVEDQLLLKEETLKHLIAWHDGKYQSIIRGFKDRDNILEKLDWIRIMYDNRRPLDAALRIRVRELISSLMEKEKLSQTEYEYLVSILVYYECI